MGERESTVRARELGAALRRALHTARLENRAVAHKLGWSESKVSLMLSGKRGTTAEDVSAVLAICDVTGPERDRLLRICREAGEPGWWQRHGSELNELQTFIAHENAAVAIRNVEAQLLPGLLQTGNYMRAVMSASVTVPVNQIDNLVAMRLTRHALFNRIPPPNCSFFIHEHALQLPIGGREVMSDQLHHLLRMSVRPYITIRVIPAAIGAHAAIVSPFVLFEFVDVRPVVHLENETSSLFLEEGDEIAVYRNILASLDRAAVDETRSRELISCRAGEFGEPREDRNVFNRPR